MARCNRSPTANWSSLLGGSGSLREPGFATTAAGTPMPVAVLPANSRLSAAGFGSACGFRWDVQRLGEPDVVAKGIAKAAVDAVGSLRRLLGELHAPGSQLVVGLAAIRGREEQVSTGGAFRHQLANLLGGLRIERRRAGFLEQDMAGVAGHVHRQPAHEPKVLVSVDLKAGLTDIELERLVLVENVDR